MLRKKYRLNKTKEFNRLFKQGTAVYGPYCGLKIMPNQLDYSRFAFLISKKVSKRAVVRNLLKRRLSEIIRQDWLKLAGYDVVIIVLPKAAAAGFTDLRTEIGVLLKRLKIAQAAQAV
jgi:ribonuclease P protein component